MGLKDAAKRLMEKAGVPVVPGYHGDAQELVLLASKASEIGYELDFQHEARSEEAVERTDLALDDEIVYEIQTTYLERSA